MDTMFSINGITSENIAEISAKQSALEELRICELSDIAHDAVLLTREMLDGGYTVYEVLSVLAEGVVLDSSSNIHEGHLLENAERLSSYLRAVNAEDKVILAQLFVLRARECGISITEGDFLSVYYGNESFTYVKNPLADEAYDVFSQDFSSPTVMYSKTLAEAARSVSQGEVEYCLLPLEERGGARLSATSELLFREDLKINRVTPVFGFEGNADMKYALVSKHFSIPTFMADDDRYLEIRLERESSLSLTELLLAADTLGAALYRVNTISFSTEDGDRQYYSVVLRDERRDFVFLLVYLTLFSGAYTPLGVYKNLE